MYYDLYWNGSSTVTQTVQGTRGTAVRFSPIAGLNEYTTFTWKIIVSDGMGGKTETTSQQKTLCSGSLYACAGGNVSYTTCPVCNGSREGSIFSLCR